MRVAIFAEYYYPFVSGVVTHIETLRQGLEAAGHEVLIVTLDPTANRHYIKDKILYCPAIALKKVYGYGVASPVNLLRLRLIRKFNPDVLHVQTEFTMGLFALWCAQQLKKPVVYTLHTLYDDYLFYVIPKRMERTAKPVFHAYIRKVASKATEIIGPSLKVAEYLKHCGVERHINVIPNTVDLTEFLETSVDQTEAQAIRKKLGLGTNDVALCFVGRLGKEKSLDVLIDYFNTGFGGQKEYKLFIIGDGPDKASLNAQITQLGLQGQVRLLGRIDHDQLPPYYHACDLFATASLSEMNSISMLEATASGLYVVQRLDLYNRDQIISGVNGDVFDSPEEFAAIVRSEAELDAAGRSQRREVASNHAKQYGIPEFTEKVLNVYQRAIYKHEAKGGKGKNKRKNK